MDKIYVGSGRILQTQFGILPKVAFSRKDLNKLIAYLDQNDSEWVNLDMKEKKEKTEGTATHYFEVSTYLSDKPKEKNEFKPSDNKIYIQGPERARVTNAGWEFDSQYKKDEESSLPF
jgi:hypothetical protein